MKNRIELYGGLFVLIDEDDYDAVSMYSWRRHDGGTKIYARSSKNVYMHRLILKAPSGIFIDHINGNGLDNRKHNLRFATKSQNGANSIHRNNKTGFRGVYATRCGSYYSIITINGQRRCLGTFPSSRLAAFRFDEEAIKLFGEFARTNL